MTRVRQLWGPEDAPRPTTTNREGYPAFQLPLRQRYLQMVLCNSITGTFYASEKQLLKDAEQLHIEMARTDYEFMAKALIFARNVGLMRLQPIFGLAIMAEHRKSGYGWVFDCAFRGVLRLPTDVMDFMTIVSSRKRGTGGRAIKRNVAEFLLNISEYHIMKYNSVERKHGYNLRDLLLIAHPKARNGVESAKLAYIFDPNNKSVLCLLPQLATYDTFRCSSVWGGSKESAGTLYPHEQAELIRAASIPHEVATYYVPSPSPEVWTAILEKMPIFATLRMLNTLDRHGALDANRELVTRRLTDIKSMTKLKIMPFQFATAYDAIDKTWVKDVLRRSVDMALDVIPDIPGRTLIALDASGSMRPGWGGYSEWSSSPHKSFCAIGAIFALALWRKTKGDTPFWLFTTQLFEYQPSGYDSILSQVDKILNGPDGGTNTAAVLHRMLTHRIAVDNLILITDEQQNTGTPLYTLMKRYQREINPNVKVFIVDMAPYKGGILPPYEPNIFYTFGWSEQVLNFVALQAAGLAGQVEAVNATQLRKPAEVEVVETEE